jgi:hypothetical protein
VDIKLGAQSENNMFYLHLLKRKYEATAKKKEKTTNKWLKKE